MFHAKKGRTLLLVGCANDSETSLALAGSRSDYFYLPDLLKEYFDREGPFVVTAIESDPNLADKHRKSCAAAGKLGKGVTTLTASFPTTYAGNFPGALSEQYDVVLLPRFLGQSELKHNGRAILSNAAGLCAKGGAVISYDFLGDLFPADVENPLKRAEETYSELLGGQSPLTLEKCEFAIHQGSYHTFAQFKKG